MSELERHWLSLPGFRLLYAIRMPNGELYTPAVDGQTPTADDYSIPTPVRDMMGMFGLFTPQESATPTEPPKPSIFETRLQAEQKLNELRALAARFGVTQWGGVVVAQLCTPFTSGDPSQEFAEQVTAWLQQQGGAK